ncbi:MAG: DegV family protein [Peptococcaceae bacterium]|jgi:DegV family protein with EDD domain|nr:DegV family protein [Peptococcaceae bacterium]
MTKNAIRIVTDSTADLPRDFAAKHRVTIVPLRIHFPEGANYLDGKELEAKDFYPLLLAAGDRLPKTSTPTQEDFRQAYGEILAENPDCQIISIHLSGALSGTINAAETAAREISPRIYTFDSRNISFGMGLQVMEAVRLIEAGAKAEKVLEYLTLVAAHTETMFCLNTLEYLYKGGRIGKVTALFGSVLNIKPLIHVKDGVYESFGKVRSQRQAIQKMVDHGLKLLSDHTPLRLGVIHGACESLAVILREKVEAAYGKTVDNFAETGAVIGVHTGPGTLGLTLCYL